MNSLRLAACLAIASAVAAQAAEWPQFRGPGRDDISKETGLLKQWPDGGPKLAWKATGIGAGYSGVSVVAGRVYTMNEKGERQYYDDEARMRGIEQARQDMAKYCK